MTEEANPAGEAAAGEVNAVAVFEEMFLDADETPANEEQEDAATGEQVTDGIDEDAPDEDAAGDSEENEDAPEEEGELLYEVKIAGETKRIPASELVKGYQMEADYRQKTAQLAEEKRNFEAEKSQYIQAIEFLQAQIDGDERDLSPQELATLAAVDPVHYMQVKAAQDARWFAREQAKALQQQERQRQSAEERQRFEAYAAEQSIKLKEAIPELADPKKGEATTKAMRAYLHGQGFSDQDISTLLDHRVVKVVYEGMKYRELQKAKPAIEEKIAKAPPKAIRPGVAKSVGDVRRVQLQEAGKRLRQTGSTKDAAAYFEQIFS